MPDGGARQEEGAGCSMQNGQGGRRGALTASEACKATLQGLLEEPGTSVGTCRDLERRGLVINVNMM